MWLLLAPATLVAKAATLKRQSAEASAARSRQPPWTWSTARSRRRTVVQATSGNKRNSPPARRNARRSSSHESLKVQYMVSCHRMTGPFDIVAAASQTLQTLVDDLWKDPKTSCISEADAFNHLLHVYLRTYDVLLV